MHIKNEINEVISLIRHEINIYSEKINKLKIKLLKELKKIFPKKFLELNTIFQEQMLVGYRIYASIVEKYGGDVVILGNAIRGTGDYYICGQYLRIWLKKNNISNYVFLTMKGSQQAVTNLFPIYKDHTYLITFDNSLYLRNFRGFVGTDKQSFIFLDHQFPFPTNRFHNISTGSLMGYHGWNIHDFYLYFGFELSETDKKDSPQFENDPRVLEELFSNFCVKKGKTALLSPYSESNKGSFMIPILWWEKLSQALTDMNYIVYTNCSGNEMPIAGTRPIFLPYKQTVPFLDKAGLFIGYRSGLCDIISTSVCKKIIIHPYKSRFWPAGASISYTGINHMGLCHDAIELEMTEENEKHILECILWKIKNGQGALYESNN